MAGIESGSVFETDDLDISPTFLRRHHGRRFRWNPRSVLIRTGVHRSRRNRQKLSFLSSSITALSESL